MKPFLSIITINRNNADGLRQTMESVLSQKCAKPFEYIIIDGASTDGSVDVIKEFLSKKKYASKISYWVSEKDSGIYNAMNKGIAHSNGVLVGILNSGDTFKENAFENLYELNKASPDAILYGAWKGIENGVFKTGLCVSAAMIPQKMIAHEAAFVPKSIYDKYGVYDESFKVAGDYDCFSRFYKNNVEFIFLDKFILNHDLCGISHVNQRVTALETEQVQIKYGFRPPLTKMQKLRRKAKDLYLNFTSKK